MFTYGQRRTKAYRLLPQGGSARRSRVKQIDVQKYGVKHKDDFQNDNKKIFKTSNMCLIYLLYLNN